MLIELADVSRARARSSGSANACFTRRWQSSKVPSTATRGDVAAECRELRFLHRADLPVGIEHHARACRARRGRRARRRCRCRRTWRPAPCSGGSAAGAPASAAISRAMARAPTSLNASVGPWKSSSDVEPRVERAPAGSESRAPRRAGAAATAAAGRRRRAAPAAPRRRRQRAAAQGRPARPGARTGISVGT